VIGVFDSGFGGLTVLRHFLRVLPERSFIFLGDSGRAPYGGREPDAILDFAEQAVERLIEEGARLIVVACNTVSCVALRHLQRLYCGPESGLRILGVTIPGAEIAVKTSINHIGIMATKRTVESGTYITEIRKLGNQKVSQRAAPLLVPLVEEGWEDTPMAREAISRYLADLPGIDTLLLGCTHYPLLMRAFEEVTPKGIKILDPGPWIADRLKDWLKRHPEFDNVPPKPIIRVLCTGDPIEFSRLGERFLGSRLPVVEYIAEKKGRLTHHDPSAAPKGQIVRFTGRRKNRDTR